MCVGPCFKVSCYLVGSLVFTLETGVNKPLLVLVACLAAVCLLPSCAEEAPPEDLDRSTPADRFAQITVSYVEHRVPGGARPQVHISGFFARHAGIDRGEVLRILNQPDVPDPQLLSMRIGDCKIVERELGRPPVEDTSFVELLDAGEIRMQFGNRGARLQRRSFPELFTNVNGLTYEGALGGGHAPMMGGSLTLRGRGSSEVGDFRVRVEVPPVPRLIALGSSPVSSPYAGIDWDEDLDVRWLVAETSPNHNVPVYIELAVLQFDRTTSLICVAPDTGMATLPHDAVSLIAGSVESDSTVQLITRRISRAGFRTARIHSSEAFFVSRDSVLLK